MNSWRLLACCTALVLAGVTSVSADQPSPIAWKIVDALDKGTISEGITPGGDTQVSVQFSAWDQESSQYLFVLFDGCNEDSKTLGRPIANLEQILIGKAQNPRNFDWADSGPRWRVCPGEGYGQLLAARKSAKVVLEVDFLRLVDEGVSPRIFPRVFQIQDDELKSLLQLTESELIQYFQRKVPDAIGVIDLYYRLRGRDARWVHGDYASVFGLPSLKGEVSTQDYVKNMDQLPVEVASYRLVRQIPGRITDDKGARLKRTLESIYSKGSGLVGRQVCYREDYEQPEVQEEGGANRVKASALLVQGRFSTRWSADHALHPGWGFMVEAYGNTATGYRDLGWSWVQSDGSWEIPVATTTNYLGGLLRVYYRSYNGYYAPMDKDEARYSWKDPDWTAPATGIFSTGHRYADTDGGTYNGVGELVDAAMTMWSRIYWTGGINPVAAEPIKFYFPNTWENCGGSSPWSCATFNGDKIWLIAAHGTQGDVVNHEMGHALNAKYWDKKWPAGSGGSHSLGGCYPTRLGMALSEGFANFIAAWVGYPARNGTEGSYNSGRWALGWDAEERTSPPNCANGWENEVWVARTFWDLHDTRTDGDDILWFIHRGAVPALFLSNGVSSHGDARDMRFYEEIYRDAASAGHEGFITDIFEQNRM